MSYVNCERCGKPVGREELAAVETEDGNIVELCFQCSTDNSALLEAMKTLNVIWRRTEGKNRKDLMYLIISGITKE